MMDEMIEKELSGFPHIVVFLQQNWEDTELVVQYLENLLRDTRENTRKGFPHDTAITLLRLFNSRKKTPISALLEEDYKT